MSVSVSVLMSVPDEISGADGNKILNPEGRTGDAGCWCRQQHIVHFQVCQSFIIQDVCNDAFDFNVGLTDLSNIREISRVEI